MSKRDLSSIIDKSFLDYQTSLNEIGQKMRYNQSIKKTSILVESKIDDNTLKNHKPNMGYSGIDKYNHDLMTNHYNPLAFVSPSALKKKFYSFENFNNICKIISRFVNPHSMAVDKNYLMSIFYLDNNVESTKDANLIVVATYLQTYEIRIDLEILRKTIYKNK